MTDTPLITPVGDAAEPQREKYVVAVFSTSRFDTARIAGTTNSVADATASRRGDIVKSINFEPRIFARDTLAKAMQIPRNAAGLPRLVRVPADAPTDDDQSAIDMREWRIGFTGDALDSQTGNEPSPLDADGILIMLPAPPHVDPSSGANPMLSGEAIAARYSLWLMLFLIELQRVREQRRSSPKGANIPVAFAVVGAEDRVGHVVQNPFARETDLFKMVAGDAGVFALSEDRRDALKIAKYFSDRLSSPTSAIVWSSPTDALLAHTPAIAFRRGRRRRTLIRATAAVAAISALGAGYSMLGPVVGAPGVTSSVAAAAHVALTAALDMNDGVSDKVRRTRIAEALELCKRPAAKCSMEDVLRLGYEMRKLRNRAE